MIEKVGERLSWIPVLIAQHDDDDDDNDDDITIHREPVIPSFLTLMCFEKDMNQTHHPSLDTGK